MASTTAVSPPGPASFGSCLEAALSIRENGLERCGAACRGAALDLEECMGRLRKLLAEAPRVAALPTIEGLILMAGTGVIRFQKAIDEVQPGDEHHSNAATRYVFHLALQVQELKNCAYDWMSSAAATGDMETFEKSWPSVSTARFSWKDAPRSDTGLDKWGNQHTIFPSRSPFRTGSGGFFGPKLRAVGSQVELAMYDLTGGLVKLVPSSLITGQQKWEGIWHCGVRCFGFEFWFGGDIFQAMTNLVPYGTPYKVVPLGITHRTYTEMRMFISRELAMVYTRDSYDGLRRNCNHFSNDLVRYLLNGKQIPEDVRAQGSWCKDIKVLRPFLLSILGGPAVSAPNGTGEVGGYPIVHPCSRPQLMQSGGGFDSYLLDILQDDDSASEMQSPPAGDEDKQDSPVDGDEPSEVGV